MKIVFGKDDSIYKIFKVIEKLPSNKNIKIEIHPKNQFFDNIWWGGQLIENLEKKSITYEFLCTENKSKRYFRQLGIEVALYKGTLFFRLSKFIYNFFLKASTLHKDIIRKKDYISYGLIGLEITFVLLIFYFFYGLISPYATIQIKPSYSIEQIAYNFRFYPADQKESYEGSRFLGMPYYTGEIKISHTMSVPVESIKYLQKPSYGKIKIINKSSFDYSLVANTKLVTQDGLMFKIKNWVKLPPASPEKPNEAIVDAQAMEVDLNGNLIGIRGNIAEGTQMYVKNLKESYYLGELYATAQGDFKGGESLTDGTISQKDIDIITDKLTSYVRQNRRLLLINNINDKNKIFLPYDDFVSIYINEIKVNGNIGDKLSNIEGTINATLGFRYTTWEDLNQTLQRYISQRDSINRKLIDIDKNSLLMNDKYLIGKLFAIPTKIDLVRGYDFNQDSNGLKNEITSKVLNKTKNEAQNIVLGYQEIDFCLIKVSPSWYDTLPGLRSRIKIEVK